MLAVDVQVSWIDAFCPGGKARKDGRRIQAEGPHIRYRTPVPSVLAITRVGGSGFKGAGQ